MVGWWVGASIALTACSASSGGTFRSAGQGSFVGWTPPAAPLWTADSAKEVEPPIALSEAPHATPPPTMSVPPMVPREPPPAPAPPEPPASELPTASAPRVFTWSASGCPSAPSGPPNLWSYQDGAKLFPTVQKGWSAKKVLERLGAPSSCAGAAWRYFAGPYSGPELTYEFTFSKGVVVGIDTSAVGCRYY